MSDEMYEQKTYVWKMPETKTLTGTALLEYASLRDQFAMAALTGLLANPKLQDQILKQGGCASGWIEDSAYGFADAMLKVREKNNGPR